MEDFHGRTHGADYAAADDPLRQFEMMKAEEVHALVKIQQAFRHIVQAEEFFMPPIKIIARSALRCAIGRETPRRAVGQCEEETESPANQARCRGPNPARIR